MIYIIISVISLTVIFFFLKKLSPRKLPGEQRPVEKIITVMFIDIRNFTKLAERNSNKEIFSLLNSYLEKIALIIKSNNGYVDKYLGDGAMAFWGGFNHDPKQAFNALKAAKEIYSTLSKEKIKVGIGISTGSVMLGYVGDNSSKSFTAIGDTVNLASRLESLNKFYNTSILSSKSTIQKLKQEGFAKNYYYREIDTVKVYGKDKEINLFEIIAKEASPKKISNSIEIFEKALESFRKRNWSIARDLFIMSQRQFVAKDPVSQIFIGRCEEHLTVGSKPWSEITEFGKM